MGVATLPILLAPGAPVIKEPGAEQPPAYRDDQGDQNVGQGIVHSVDLEVSPSNWSLNRRSTSYPRLSPWRPTYSAAAKLGSAAGAGTRSANAKGTDRRMMPAAP